MRLIAVAFSAWLLFVFPGGGKQDGKPPAKEYKLTEIQLLRLQNTQKDAFLIKAQIQDLQRQFGDKVTQLYSTAEKIKLENSWPPDTHFDIDTLQFTAPAKEGEKK